MKTSSVVKGTCFALVAFFYCGCGSSQSHRKTAREENNANIQAEYEDLAPAEGTFRGTVTLSFYRYQNNSKTLIKKLLYGATLSLQRIYRNDGVISPTDPAEKINIPKLSGSLQFDVLQGMPPDAWIRYPELMAIIGGFGVIFDNGDYNPDSHLLSLPYAIAAYKGANFGELSGTLLGDDFSGPSGAGTWFSKSPVDVNGAFREISFRFTRVSS